MEETRLAMPPLLPWLPLDDKLPPLALAFPLAMACADARPALYAPRCAASLMLPVERFAPLLPALLPAELAPPLWLDAELLLLDHADIDACVLFRPSENTVRKIHPCRIFR